ncbi:hypothetical protein [Enteroccous phage Ef212]|nr:hypothetical protein [Enteroccous phage Ef212]
MYQYILVTLVMCKIVLFLLCCFSYYFLLSCGLHL